MEKASKKNSKLLLLTIILVLVVSSAFVVVFVVNFNRNGVNQSFGTFILKFESHNRNSWTFSAQSVQGYSTIFRDLSQEDLNRIFVNSRVAEGEMLLILSQGEKSYSINLSEGEMYLSAEDMCMDMFSPGQIRKCY